MLQLGTHKLWLRFGLSRSCHSKQRLCNVQVLLLFIMYYLVPVSPTKFMLIALCGRTACRVLARLNDNQHQTPEGLKRSNASRILMYLSQKSISPPMSSSYC